MGNCSAVKGRFRASSAVYPAHNLPVKPGALHKRRNASADVEEEAGASGRRFTSTHEEDDDDEEEEEGAEGEDEVEEVEDHRDCRFSIWAFCLMTSAGAMARHAAASANADAAA